MAAPEQNLALLEGLATASMREPHKPINLVQLAESTAPVTITFHPDTKLDVLSTYVKISIRSYRRDILPSLLEGLPEDVSNQNQNDCVTWETHINALRDDDKTSGDIITRRTTELTRSLSALVRCGKIKTVGELRELSAKISANLASQGKLDTTDTQINDLLAKPQMSPTRLLFLAACFPQVQQSS